MRNFLRNWVRKVMAAFLVMVVVAGAAGTPTKVYADDPASVITNLTAIRTSPTTAIIKFTANQGGFFNAIIVPRDVKIVSVDAFKTAYNSDGGLGVRVSASIGLYEGTNYLGMSCKEFHLPWEDLIIYALCTTDNNIEEAIGSEIYSTTVSDDYAQGVYTISYTSLHSVAGTGVFSVTGLRNGLLYIKKTSEPNETSQAIMEGRFYRKVSDLPKINNHPNALELRFSAVNDEPPRYVVAVDEKGVVSNILRFPPDASNPAPGYIYDTVDPALNLALPLETLTTVTDTPTAVAAINKATSGMTAEQKQSPTGVDLVTLYAEEAVSQAASKDVPDGEIFITQSGIADLQTAAAAVKTAASGALSSGGITADRDLSASVKFKTQRANGVKITIDPTAAKAAADKVRVETPDYFLSFSRDFMQNGVGNEPLTITITENAAVPSVMTGEKVKAQPMSFTNLASGAKSFSVAFSRPANAPVMVSLPPLPGDTTYQAVLNSKGDVVGGKYNPITQALEALASSSDTLTIKVNEKDFSDIQNKSKEMRDAIKYLASKGIINGTSPTTFAPDGTISRAEIAALITKAISEYDAGADGGFKDVQKSDWFFAAAGSAKQSGYMSGVGAAMFEPKTVIPKQQIVAVSARVLRNKMKYKNPANPAAELKGFADSGSVADWATADIALAARENLIVRRTDGKFEPGGNMTRGDAAIILHRMFAKIWN